MLTRDQSIELGLRWGTGQHIADRKPVQVVEFRTGRFKPGYAPWEGPPVNAVVAGGYVRNPGDPVPDGWPIEGYGRLFWQKFWTPDEGDAGVFATIPNVLDVDFNQDFTSNGIMSGTIVIENVAYPELVGPLGVYYSVQRGYYAPNRGFHAEGIPTAGEANEWFQRFKHNGQFRVWQGYGDLLVPVFTGLTDTIDTESAPDRITITARDFGQALSDQKVFGWNKEPRIKDPVVFIDRMRANNVQKVLYDVTASSTHPDHPVTAVSDTDSDTYWLSAANDSPNAVEWLQGKVPQGRYEDVYVFPRQRGMDIYISIFSRSSTRNGEAIPDGWVDTGQGDVPGGGIPYVTKRLGMLDNGVYMALDGVYRLGEGSTIRLTMTSLPRRADNNFYAGLNRFFARRLTLSEVARDRHYVLVDDVSDMVRCVLRWAGFKEWDVETSGVRLKERFVVPRSQAYMDVIKAAQDQTGFVFYMKEPTDADLSIGIPCFRRPVVVDERFIPRAFVRDADLLTAIKTTDSDEPRAYIIRVRGRTAREGEREGFVPLSGDSTKRLMYVYKPPWWRKLGGIVKHVVYTNNAFKTMDDCKFAAFYIALQEALEAEKATVELPGLPGWEDADGRRYGVELDSHIAVLDVGTGSAQRLYVTNRQSKFHAGEQATFTASVSGAWIDTPDIREITRLIRETPRGAEH